MKTKKITRYLLFFIILFFPFTVLLGETTTDFLKEEAGITAYAKIDGIDENNNADKLNEMQAFIESKGAIRESKATHIIGKIPISLKIEDIDSEDYFYLPPIDINIYFDIDGWLAVYLLRDKPTSKIINWENYSPGNLSPSILEKKIERLSSEINKSHSPVDYYHFGYEDATQMSIVVDSIDNKSGIFENNYSITIPKTIYETSYSIYYSLRFKTGQACLFSLKVDGDTVKQRGAGSWCRGEDFYYETYPDGTFSPNTPHSVLFGAQGGSSSTEIRIGTGSVFLYAGE